MIFGNMTERDFQGLKITQTRRVFLKTASGKSWKSKPCTDITEQITAAEYIRAAGNYWKGDRVEKGYTYAGYIPVRITNYCPSGAAKCVWIWHFEIVKGDCV